MTVTLAPLPRQVRICHTFNTGIHVWTAVYHQQAEEPLGRLEAYIPQHEKYVYLQEFRVCPLWRRKGIGSTMLVNALALLHSMGHTAYLLVARDNTDAQKLYARLGGKRDDNDSREHYTYWFPAHRTVYAAP